MYLYVCSSTTCDVRCTYVCFYVFVYRPNGIDARASVVFYVLVVWTSAVLPPSILLAFDDISTFVLYIENTHWKEDRKKNNDPTCEEHNSKHKSKRRCDVFFHSLLLLLPSSFGYIPAPTTTHQIKMFSHLSVDILCYIRRRRIDESMVYETHRVISYVYICNTLQTTHRYTSKFRQWYRVHTRICDDCRQFKNRKEEEERKKKKKTDWTVNLQTFLFVSLNYVSVSFLFLIKLFGGCNVLMWQQVLRSHNVNPCT